MLYFNDCKLLLIFLKLLLIFIKLMLMFYFKFFAVVSQFKMHQQREED